MKSVSLNLNFCIKDIRKTIAFVLFSIVLFAFSLFFCGCSCSGVQNGAGQSSNWDIDVSKLKLANDASQIVLVGVDKEDSSYADLILAEKRVTNAQTVESTDEKIITKEEAEIGKAIKSRDEGTDAGDVKNQQREEDSNVDKSESQEEQAFDPSNVEYEWNIVLKCKVRISNDGIGKNSVDDNKTPKGVFGITQAFGNEVNPGTLLDYVKTDCSYYWVRDTKSAYYNKLVSTNNVKKDWNDAENIGDGGQRYNYGIVLDYNISGNDTKKGSGIFFECGGNQGTDGSISLSENDLKKLLVFSHSKIKIVIDTKDNISKY